MLKRLSAGLVTAVMALGTAVLFSGTANAGATGHPPVHLINLRSAYRQALPHATAGRKIVLPPRGKHATAPVANSACTEPDHCNMTYHGGPVQHSVQLYLLLWGPNWSSDSSQQASASYLESFYAGLGAQPQDNWSTITSQYGDASGFPSFNGSVYRGVWQDTSTPPHGVTQSQLTAEADAFANQRGIASNDTDAQIVIATQSGTCPAGFYAPGCFNGSGYYCAWHSYDDSNVPFTNLPYLLDAGSGCGEYFDGGMHDGLSMVGGHEYAETITDPLISAWYDPNDTISGGEIGDKCVWGGEAWGGSDPYSDVTLSTGSFAMQSLYSNTASACVMTGPTGGDMVTITNPGTRSGRIGRSVSLKIQAASSTGATLSYDASGLPPGLTMNSATGVIGGTLSQTAGRFTVDVKVSDTAGGSAAASFRWNVSSGYGAIHGYDRTCVRANSARTHPELYSCGKTRETWKFRSSGEVHLARGGCIRYKPSTRKLVLSACSATARSQRWYRLADHQYVNEAAGVCMTDPSGSVSNGTQLAGRACKDRRYQKWSLP